MALIQKVDKGRYENKQSRLSSPQFGIITIAFSDFTSDLTWGFQLLLAGGQIAAVFGALSLVAAVGVVIYNARMLQKIRGSEKVWTEMNRTHMAERIFGRSHSTYAVPRYQRN